MKSLIAAAALLMIPGAALAQTTATPTPTPPAADSVANIYGTALGPGWVQWPWEGSTIELSVELTGSPRRPIKVTPGNWGALYLHHEPFSTQPYRSIGFLAQVVGEPTKIQVIALVGGKPIEGRNKIIDLAPGGWKRVEFALADIGAANVMIDGLWIQSVSATPGPAFYVTEIALHE